MPRKASLPYEWKLCDSENQKEAGSSLGTDINMFSNTQR